MDLEDQMCRAPLAWMFNHVVPGCTWITEANAGIGIYESGRPDGFVAPWMLPLECKAFRGSLYMGNPEKPPRLPKDWKRGDPQPEKKGFHTAQRDWMAGVCRKPGAYIPFQLAVWLNPATAGRIDHSQDRLFIVNADRWLDLEYVAVNKFETRSVPLNDAVTNYRYRHELNVERWFAPFALTQYRRITDKGKNEIAWFIPKWHPMWDDIIQHQKALVENIQYQRNISLNQE